MSEAAVSEDTQTTETSAFVDPTDEIASLLLETEETPESDESEEAEEPTAESTEEDEVDESESTEETVDETDEDVDATWGSALGIPEDAMAFDEDGNVTGINVNVKGKLSTVPMTDLIKDYQGNKAYTEKSKTLAEDRRVFDEAKKVTEQDYSSKLENVELITNYLSNKLVQEFEGINWDQLRVENAAEYAAARQDYAARAQELKQAQDAVSQEKKQAADTLQQQNETSRKARMTEQFNIMVGNNPDWANDEVRSTAMTGLRSFAKNQYGFADTDFNNVQDARILEILKDAKAYREGVKVATTKRKKPVPKFQKSAGAKTKKRSKLDTLTRAAKTAKGARKRVAQTDAVAALLMGN